MCEVGLGGMLVIWSNGIWQPAGRQAFGHTGSVVVVAIVMILVALGMVTVLLDVRLTRAPRLSLLLALAIAAGALGTMTITTFFLEPYGPGILLVLDLIGVVVVLQQITRSAAGGKQS